MDKIDSNQNIFRKFTYKMYVYKVDNEQKKNFSFLSCFSFKI